MLFNNLFFLFKAYYFPFIKKNEVKKFFVIFICINKYTEIQPIAINFTFNCNYNVPSTTVAKTILI